MIYRLHLMRWLILLLVASMLSCARPAMGPTADSTVYLPLVREGASTQTTPSPPTPEAISHQNTSVALTYQQPDGNRFVDGNTPIIPLNEIEPTSIVLTSVPVWVVGLPYETENESGVFWLSVLSDGTVQAFSVIGATDSREVIELTEFTPAQVPPAMPPLVYLGVNRDGSSEPRLLVPNEPFAPATHPVLLNNSGDYAYLNESFELVVMQGETKTVLAVDALPDARLLVDENERILLLSAPTDRYAHGVLGDRLEAGSVTLVETNPETVPVPAIANTIVIPEAHVIEGISPIWTDITGDGVRDIIVTHSDARQGAQIVVYAETGELLGAGPAIGRGNRWRHQLAVAPFSGDEPILVDVLTPHIGGVVEFYTWENDELTIVGSLSGYTSHMIGSRNLDMAAAADFDGDGQVELLLPTQNRRTLGAIRFTGTEAELAWSMPVDGSMGSNIAVVPLMDGNMAVAVGRQNGSLRIWQP
ncbi:MAG: hypothetical protein AAF639_21865 [Chloroflexota bacterium]